MPHRALRRSRDRIVRGAAAALVAAWALATVLAAQAPALPAGPLTLEQVLDVAEARSEAIALARLALQRIEPERARALSGRYPQLSASASYDRSLANEFSGVFDSSGGSSCPGFALNQTASLEDRVKEIERAIDCGAVGGSFFGGGGDSGSDSSGDDDGLSDLPFGRANTWRATLSFSQNLYDGGRIRGALAAADVARETAEQGVTAATAQLLFDVTQAYYDAALSERLVTIAQATLDQAGATLVQAQASFDAGTQPEFEVVRARVARDNQQPNLIRQRVSRDVALLRLKQLLELPAEQELRLADTLSDEALAPPPVFASRLASVERALGPGDAVAFTLQADVPLPERNVVAQAVTAVKLREAQLKLVELERKPVVTLTSNYSRIAYPSIFLPAFERSNWSVGAGLSMPILTGGRQKADETLARMDVDRAKLEHRQVAEIAALDTRSAWAELVAARAAWQATAGTVQQATRAFEIATVRFSAGVSTQLELSDSRLLLQQAEANRAQAARDLQVARARVVLLPNLPLSGAPGITPAPVPSTPSVPSAPAAPAAPGGGQATQRNASIQSSSQTGVR